MKKSNFTLLKMLLMFGLIPLGCTLAAFFLLTFINVNVLVHKHTRMEIYMCNQEFNNYISGMYGDEIGSENWNQWKERSLVDVFKKDDIEMAIYFGDKTTLASMENENGLVLDNFKGDPEIVSAVLRGGKHYQSDKEIIGGEEYFVDYLPLKNSGGRFMGMTFVGKKASTVRNEVFRIIVRVMICGVSLLLVFSVVIILVARIVKKPFADIATALGVCAEGHVSESFTIHSIVKENKKMIYSLGQFQESLNGTV